MKFYLIYYRISGGKRRKHHADSELDSDFDENDESVAVAKPKKRKQATEETLCMKCLKSSNPEVVSLRFFYRVF